MEKNLPKGRCAPTHRHCEERSDAAIQEKMSIVQEKSLDCFTSFAMTREMASGFPFSMQQGLSRLGDTKKFALEASLI